MLFLYITEMRGIRFIHVITAKVKDNIDTVSERYITVIADEYAMVVK